MKLRFIGIILALILIFLFTACSGGSGGDSKPSASTSSSNSGTPTSSTNTPSSTKSNDLPDTPLSEFTYEYDAGWGGIVITEWSSSNNTLRVKIPSEIEGQPVVGVARRNKSKAFMNAGIMEVILPDTLTHIGKESFQHSSITNIVFPDSLKVIEGGAFWGCVGLTSITIPCNVTELGQAFRSTHLTDILVDPANMYFSSVDGVLFNKDQSILVHYPMGKIGKEYSIPDGTVGFEMFAFDIYGDCTTELEHLIIPDSVVSFPNYTVESTAEFLVTYRGAMYSNHITEDGAGLAEFYAALENYNNN